MAGGKSSYPLSVVIEAVDKISGPMRKISASISGMTSKIGNSLRSISDRSGLPILTNALGNVGRATKGFGSAVVGVGKSLLTFAAAAGLSTAALGAFFKSYADQTGAIGDLAERTGASRERIQELGFAAQLTGSSTESLAAAFQKMNLTLANAKAGSKELKEMFAGLKIKPKDIDSADKAFDTFVDRISRIKDPTLQAKAAMAIFGKGAGDLLPLLRGGTKDLKAMTDEARRLGIVISDDAVKEGENFGDVIDTLMFSIRGAANTIAQALVPQLSKLGTQLTETIVKYRPQIEAFAKAFAENLPGYIDQVVQGLQEFWTVIKPLAGAVAALSDNLGAIALVFDVVAGVVIATLLPSVWAVTTAVYALGAALLATPVGWILAGLVALAGAAYAIYQNWDQFASFFTEKFDKVKAAFKTSIIDGLITAWKEFNIVSFMMDSINSLVKFITGIDLGALIKKSLGMGGDVKVGIEGPHVPSVPLVTPGARDTNGDPDYAAVPKGGALERGLADAQAKITVDFRNLPQGADVEQTSNSGAKVQVNQGYSMMAVR